MIGNLNDFIDGELEPELCEEISKHLNQCDNCRIMVDTLKMTVKLCRDGKEEKLPPSLENKLNNLLKDRWIKKFGKA
jgi:anti-sigma factor RsiW